MTVTVPASAQADAPAGQMIRSLVPLGSVMALVGLVTSFVSPFLPLFLSRDLRASPGLVSLFLFLMPLASVAIGTVVGRLSDRPGLRPRLLIIGAVTGSLAFVLFAVLRGYWVVLVVALTLFPLGASLNSQTFAFSRAFLDRRFPSRAATGISSLRSLLSLAWVAGPPLAAYVIQTLDFRGLYLLAAGIYLAILPVLFRFRREESAQSVAGAAEPGPTPRSLWQAAAAFTVLQSALSLGVMSMSLYVSVNLHRDLSDAGLILGLCAALEIPLMLLFGWLAARRSLYQLVVIGAGIGIAYSLTMSLTTAVWQIAAAQLLNACFIATVSGLGISYFQDLMPTRLGHATTMFTNSYRIGVMLAGLIFGVVQVVGYRYAYLFGAVLCACGLALLAYTRNPQPRAQLAA
jgi:MFS transporter, SET family, sugar efflux transporter